MHGFLHLEDERSFFIIAGFVGAAPLRSQGLEPPSLKPLTYDGPTDVAYILFKVL